MAASSSAARVGALVPALGRAAGPLPGEHGDFGEDLVGLVNTMQGTDSQWGFSRGNTLPLASCPFGMTHWSPQNAVADGWFFDPNRHQIQGVRGTHQPSPWMGDYGHFTVMAQAGEIALLPALPTAWPTGSVRGLRARGGFEVSLVWKGGKLQSATLHSVGGSVCRVRYADKAIDLHLKPGAHRRLTAQAFA